jgi:hypothetical protein
MAGLVYGAMLHTLRSSGSIGRSKGSIAMDEKRKGQIHVDDLKDLLCSERVVVTYAFLLDLLIATGMRDWITKGECDSVDVIIKTTMQSDCILKTLAAYLQDKPCHPDIHKYMDQRADEILKAKGSEDVDWRYE